MYQFHLFSLLSIFFVSQSSFLSIHHFLFCWKISTFAEQQRTRQNKKKHLRGRVGVIVGHDLSSKTFSVKIPVLPEEPPFGLAIARGRLADFDAFRTRYEKFSAYEDLLADAYEQEAKVALTRKLGPNPSWSDFKWFEGRYGQSNSIGQARARILTAELGRVSVNPTVKGFQTLRDRFADWEEFDAWFDWLHAALGIAREFPVTVDTSDVDT